MLISTCCPHSKSSEMFVSAAYINTDSVWWNPQHPFYGADPIKIFNLINITKMLNLFTNSY